MGEPVLDGNSSFLGGQNAGLDASLISPTQYAKGVNFSVKDGNAGPRPGFTEINDILVTTEGGVTGVDGRTRTYQTIFRTGKFQGAGPYIADQGKFIIATVSGVIFSIDVKTRRAVVINVDKQKSTDPNAVEPPTQRLNQYMDRHNWAEAGKYFTVFDYPDLPIIIDGHMAHRADPTKYEIPIPAVLGAYNQHRLFVFSKVHEFTAGDPVGNQATANAPITFEEVFAPAAAFPSQIFSLGSTNINNPITAVGFLQAVDGSTDIGNMFVATKNSTYGYPTQLERTSWSQTSFGSLILDHEGIAGQRAFDNVGTDLWFLDGEGRVRSFSVARSDQQKWSRTPLDKEVRNWFRFCDPDLIKYSVVAYHNNRILITVNPQLTPAKDLEGRETLDVSFRGLVALELDPISGFLQSGTPCWAGLWTGINPMEIVQIDEELYIFSKDPGNVNVLYKVEPDEITWDTYQGKKKQIVSQMDTRAYNFAQQGLNYALKEEVTLYPGFKNVGGKFCVQVERRNDDYPNYIPWRTFKHDAPIQKCEAGKTLSVLAPHTFREINFGDPEDPNVPYNPVTKENMRYFDETQFRLTITGLTWAMNAFRVKAELQEDDMLISQLIQPEHIESGVEVPLDCSMPGPFDLYSTAEKQGVWQCQKPEC